MPIVSHRTIYLISGAIWMAIGIMLLNLGIGFLMHGQQAAGFAQEGYSGLFLSLSSLATTSENAVIILLALALFLGFAKGKFVMQKAALRTQERLLTLGDPISLKHLYTKSNLIIIGCMMLLGMSMKAFTLPYDIRGIIDIAVGAALIKGALGYLSLRNP